jgi:glycosyltransferase involved in cell wall biosynthesis
MRILAIPDAGDEARRRRKKHLPRLVSFVSVNVGRGVNSNQRAIRRILVPVSGALGEDLAGPQIRAVEFAKALGREYEVTLASGAGTDGERDGVRVIAADRPRLLRESARHDAILAGSFPPYLLACKSLHRFVAITDQYDPHDHEIATKQQTDRQRDRELRTRAAWQKLQLRYADIVLCASERQRTQLLRGRDSTPGSRSRGPDPVVVPFGIPDPPPPSSRRPLHERFPQLADGDTLVLWWGSVWRWLDADTAVRAFATIAASRPDLKLVITAGRPPHGGSERFYNAADDVRALAADLGVLGSTVLFLDEWIPYDRRHDYLREADIGLTLHRHAEEARLAARARYMDYLSAELPCVLGRGDETAEEFGAAGFATLLDSPSPNDLAAALLALADDPGKLPAARAAGHSLAAQHRWSAVGAKLSETVAAVSVRRPTSGRAALGLLGRTGAYYARRVHHRALAP